MCKGSCQKICNLKGETGLEITMPQPQHLCPAMQKKLQRAAEAAQHISHAEQQPAGPVNSVSTANFVIQ